MVDVLGLDLSLVESGFAGSQGDDPADVGTGTIKTTTAHGDRRLNHIRSRCRLLAGGRTLVLIEGFGFASKGLDSLAMVHGAVRSELIDAGVPYAVVPPPSLKKYATGKGNGTKVDMAVAAFKRTGREYRNDNECDAFWLWVMAQDYLGRPVFELPKINRESLTKIEKRFEP